MVNLNDEAYTLKSQLDGEEHILWVGKAGGSIIFRTIDAFLIPFSLLWGGFALFWEIMVLASGAPIFFALFGLPFVLVGLFLIFGRFYWDARRRKHTLYALTDKRIIFRTGARTQQITTLNLADIKSLSLKLKPDSRGTISFYTNTMGVAVSKALTDFQLFAGAGSCFELIDEAQEVYKKISALINKQEGEANHEVV